MAGDEEREGKRKGKVRKEDQEERREGNRKGKKRRGSRVIALARGKGRRGETR